MGDRFGTPATLRDPPFRLRAEACHLVDYRTERGVSGRWGEQTGSKPIAVFEGVVDWSEDLGRRLLPFQLGDHVVEICGAVVCTQRLLEDPTLLSQLQGSELSADALGLRAVCGFGLCLRSTDNVGMLMGQGQLVAGEALWQVGITAKTELAHLLDQVRLGLGSEKSGLHVHNDVSGEIVLEKRIGASMTEDLVPQLFADTPIYNEQSAKCRTS